MNVENIINLKKKKIIYNSDIEYNIESYLENNTGIISGWTILKNLNYNSVNYNIMIKYKRNKKILLPCYLYESKDIAKIFNSEKYNYSRWKTFTNLKKEDIKEIFILIENNECCYIKKIWDKT